MGASFAALLVGLAGWYAAAGVLFAVPFTVKGIERIDPLAAGSAWSFRLLIVPATVMFWPLLLLRWAAGSVAPPVEVNAHRRAARPPAGGGQDNTASSGAEPLAHSLPNSRRSLAG